jgi:hypothetical protein
MRVIEAPADFSGAGPSLFLAGGITGCPDWQRDLLALLADIDLVFFNPRRHNYPINVPDLAEEQITWEFEHLRRADAIVFWFPRETLCPIALYELGAWSMTAKHLFVGAHPDYSRRVDVATQTRLARPDVRVVSALPELASAVRAWCRRPAP